MEIAKDIHHYSTRLEAITSRLEAIASRLEAIAIWLGAITIIRLEAIAISLPEILGTKSLGKHRRFANCAF